MLTQPTSRYKIWSTRVTVDGKSYDAVDLPSRTIALAQARSSCSVALKTMPPSGTSGKDASVDVGYSTGGVTTWRRFFTGYSAPDTMVSNPVSNTLNLVDVLYKLNRSLKETGTSRLSFSNISYVNALKKILKAADISDAMIGGLYNPGSTYTVAPVQKIGVGNDEELSTIWKDLLDFGGCAAYVDPSGIVRVLPRITIPPSSAPIRYSADAPTSTEYRVISARSSLGTFEEIVSTFTATGLPLAGSSTGSQAAPSATYYANGIIGKAESMQNRFIQTTAHASLLRTSL